MNVKLEKYFDKKFAKEEYKDAKGTSRFILLNIELFLKDACKQVSTPFDVASVKISDEHSIFSLLKNTKPHFYKQAVSSSFYPPSTNCENGRYPSYYKCLWASGDLRYLLPCSEISGGLLPVRSCSSARDYHGHNNFLGVGHTSLLYEQKAGGYTGDVYFSISGFSSFEEPIFPNSEE